jgi:hypothetical protein
VAVNGIFERYLLEESVVIRANYRCSGNLFLFMLPFLVRLLADLHLTEEQLKPLRYSYETLGEEVLDRVRAQEKFNRPVTGFQRVKKMDIRKMCMDH